MIGDKNLGDHECEQENCVSIAKGEVWNSGDSACDDDLISQCCEQKPRYERHSVCEGVDWYRQEKDARECEDAQWHEDFVDVVSRASFDCDV